MKLLHTHNFTLESFPEPPSQSYACLSYTWGTPPHGEVSHRDVVGCGARSPKADYGTLKDRASLPAWARRDTESARRVVGACSRAREVGIKYLWVDTICIDRTSLADISEAINSMYRWYRQATVCYAHLSDLAPSALPSTDDVASAMADCSLDETSLGRSRWFTRGWTLQELLLPRRLELYDREWNLRGSKSSSHVVEMLSRISGVETAVLSDPDRIADFSYGRRMAWAAKRQVTRGEDAAYALLPILGVNMTVRYGEGGERAFQRLQEKVIRVTTDLSPLCWRSCWEDEMSDEEGEEGEQFFGGCLASSPAEFSHFVATPEWQEPFHSDAELQFNNKGLNIRAPLAPWRRSTRDVVMYLNSSSRSREGMQHVGVLLRECEPGVFARLSPKEVVRLPLRKGVDLSRRVCIRRSIDKRTSQKMYAEQSDLRIASWMDSVAEGQSSSSTTASKQSRTVLKTEQ